MLEGRRRQYAGGWRSRHGNSCSGPSPRAQRYSGSGTCSTTAADMTETATIEIPSGYMQDAEVRLVPESVVKHQHKQEDRHVRELMQGAVRSEEDKSEPQ